MCLVETCNRPAGSSRGWCQAHYNRWRRHGDPLGGATIQGEPQRFFKEIVMAYEGDECLTWPFGCNADGYGLLKSAGRVRNVHRLVCEQEYGPPPSDGYDAAHNCGKGKMGCVSKHHLRWATRKENLADRILHGVQIGRPKTVR